MTSEFLDGRSLKEDFNINERNAGCGGMIGNNCILFALEALLF
jgi:hypothetical protein